MRNNQRLGVIEQGLPNTGMSSWNVGQYAGGMAQPGSGYQIKVKVTGKQGVFGQSAAFTIGKPVLVVSQPTAAGPNKLPAPLPKIASPQKAPGPFPEITSRLAIPGGPLMPGSKLYLMGNHFGDKPGKILLNGAFPVSPVPLDGVKWESAQKVNGVVPQGVAGLQNQQVSVYLKTADDRKSNAVPMDFLGQPEFKCGEAHENYNIYARGGKFGPVWKEVEDCKGFACQEKATGPVCPTSCASTADCVPLYVCTAESICALDLSCYPPMGKKCPPGYRCVGRDEAYGGDKIGTQRVYECFR